MTLEAVPRTAEPEEGGLLGDRYIVGRVLGSGATAEVRSGWDRRLERPVAIKVLRSELAYDPLVRRRFGEEARAAARLSHPNVVAVFDTADPDGDEPPYIVMERLPGDTLRSTLESGPLPAAAVRDLAAQMLSALGAGAAAGLLHCDVKPGNILATDDGRWKLADFGIARSTGLALGGGMLTSGAGPEDTVAGTVMGTPAYLPPERLCGQAATESADVFSLGVVLYEALTGRRPYRSTDSYPWSTALLGRPAEPVRSVTSGVPPRLAAAVDRAVRLDPADRFATAEEMAAAIDEVRSRKGPGRLAASGRTRRVVTGAVAAAAALAVSVAVVNAGGATPAAPAGADQAPEVQPAASSHPGTPTPTTAATVAARPASTVPPAVPSGIAPIGPAAAMPARPAPAVRHGKGPGPHHRGPAGG